MTAERPAGVIAVAMVFLVAAVYLLGVGLAMLVRPGSISMAAGAELLGGLELAGPYMFLLMAAVGAIIALGLWQRQDWARWIAILVALIGVVLLLPSVSSALFDFRLGKLAWGGLETIVRSLVVWYLYQPAVREAYTRK
jgi:hypothetical protein